MGQVPPSLFQFPAESRKRHRRSTPRQAFVTGKALTDGAEGNTKVS